MKKNRWICFFYTTRVLLCLFVVSSHHLLQGQTLITVKQGCNFAADTTSGDIYAYDASAEAKQIVERIMKLNVLPQNFTVKSADITNALATTEGKQRYILYSTTFLEHFKKQAQTHWAAYCVLAHEIGHHLSNHDLEEKTPSVRKRFELEADQFAGGILFRLGATLEEAQAGVNTFSLNNESATHPPKRARLEAIAVGWKQAQEQADIVSDTEGSARPNSEEKKLYDKAVAETDVYKAIALLDEAIELKEDYAEAYLERGKRKISIEEVDINRVNYDYAVEDLNAYILLKPKNPLAFMERGYAYRKLGKNKESLDDYNRAIRLNDKNPQAFLERAYVKMKMDDTDAALRDIEKAIVLKPDFAEAWYMHGNILYGYGHYDKAINDFDKTLKANPQHFAALTLRAAAKQFNHQYAEALDDYNRLQLLAPKKFTDYFDRGVCYQYLNKHRQAIADFDVLLEDNPDNAAAHLHRGVSEYILGQTTAGLQDIHHFFKQRVSSAYQNLTDFKIVNKGLASLQTQIGCLFVEYQAEKIGLEWLEMALAADPSLENAKTCKAKAVKK